MYCRLLTVLLLVLVVLSRGEIDEATIEEAGKRKSTLDDYQKLSVKSLRAMLKAKGLDCKGCSEKWEFAKMVFESQDIPNVEPAGAQTKAGYTVPPGVDQDKIDELMANLKKGGFGNSKMFSGDDLKNMSPEELSAKLGGERNKWNTGKGGRPKGKKTKAVKRDIDDGGETIEL
jgi:hypothetical protein